ncbi:MULTISPECIES: DUF771 domain-containing protein [unclassified Paenibacillus]|uniref:DUF771 domain-containing protein n=1 Tax=unclassified Paenibacillus TaxID=185978 RepID=UPI0009556740|nr:MULTISPECIES: DUF771 domain-containing protein [unclassified Paenibacillus]ASS66397.1 DUF771 domain-containing protein [Paenibacillus sp. RUD330]SIQ05601.1 Prophage pi2 protein 07 [Paenibacillus sp. RU4X]SIQ25749.1 Prophage pi2 protein 07 [Paenibacillus sp. RU4T]
MQHLNVQLTIPIPSDSVLISKIELEELRSQELAGVFWSMQDLERRINRKTDWIKENILFPSKFRLILDSENGGFVFYPKCKGQTWSFQAVKMSKFLETKFAQIFDQL